MQRCLGIYIENNLIKYAKVSKDRDDFKIEAFGMKFFHDNLAGEIKKVVEETFSFNIPISVNLMGEKYLYFDIFALLSKQDIQKSVDTEFETYCEEHKYNSKAFETRHALVKNIENNEKIKAIDVVVNKIELNKQKSYFDKNYLIRITPIGTAITSIVKLQKKENVIIVNMEDKTTITTIYNNQIYNIETMECGSEEVLQKINKVENSLNKAYEICKETTIYTSNVEATQIEQPHLEDILPALYQICQKVKKILDDSLEKISTVYLTGTLSVINNIDLYFQEFLPAAECKILKPNIMEATSSQVNIKDYVEVNSAISLAMTALGEGTQSLNFKDSGVLQKVNAFMGQKVEFEGAKNEMLSSFKSGLSKTEGVLIRICVAILLVNVIFFTFSKMLYSQMDNKQKEVEKLITSEKSEVDKINSDTRSLQEIDNEYVGRTEKLKAINNKLSNIAEMKNSIPNLLNQIMYNIPESVQLISIQNDSERHVVIDAQSTDYDQLGYFISQLKLSKILNDVVSSRSQKSNGYVRVTIEGEIP